MITTSITTSLDLTIFHAHCGDVCYRVLFCETGIIASVLDHAESKTAQRIDIFFRDQDMKVINKTC